MTSEEKLATIQWMKEMQHAIDEKVKQLQFVSEDNRDMFWARVSLQQAAAKLIEARNDLWKVDTTQPDEPEGE